MTVNENTKSGQSVTSEHKPCCSCQLCFAKDKVRIVVEQNSDADAKEKERYNSAHQQVVAHMIARPPKTFNCVTFGDLTAPRTELVLQRSVLEQLPLLLDISESTTGVIEETHIDIQLPCSVWGLASLLLLLEGAVKQYHWFGVASDPSLPAQTLLVRSKVQAADFFRCTHVREDILEHLRSALAGTIEALKQDVQPSAASKSTPAATHQAWTRQGHNIKVLRHVPQCFSSEVFQAGGEHWCVSSRRFEPSESILQDVLHLPQDFLGRWIECNGPVLDLDSLEATELQWNRLLTELPRLSSVVSELIICPPTEPEVEAPGEELLKQLCSDCGAVAISKCATCSRREQKSGKFDTAVPGMIAYCRRCSNASASRRLASRNFVKSLTTVMRKSRGSFALPTEFVRCLAGVLPQLSSLQHLGLRNLNLQRDVVPALGQILLDLPPSVTKLTLQFSKVGKLEHQQRNALFSAIAQVASLKELHIPDWEAIVGSDVAYVEPLYRLPHLEVVYVGEVKDSSTFPATLNFQSTP